MRCTEQRCEGGRGKGKEGDVWATGGGPGRQEMPCAVACHSKHRRTPRAQNSPCEQHFAEMMELAGFWHGPPVEYQAKQESGRGYIFSGGGEPCGGLNSVSPKFMFTRIL